LLPGGSEGRDLHYPVRRAGQGAAGAVGSDARYGSIVGDVGVDGRNIRVVNPELEPLNTPVVIPAPKSSSAADMVVMFPLVAVLLEPELDAVVSSALVGSNPLYSALRISGYGTADENCTVTVLLPAPAALMFLA
jgi:hypothetical protein